MEKQANQANTNFTSKQITTGVWDIIDSIPNDPIAVDIYVVEGTDRALVIDSGVSGSDLLSFINTLTDKPVDLAVTHGHGDHMASAAQFESVYMSSKDFDLIKPYVPYKNFESTGMKELRDGNVFDLGGCTIEVLALPGHTAGSVVLLDRERGLLFTGDSIGSGSFWMQLPESSSIEEFRDEIIKLEKALEGLGSLKLLLGHSCMMGHYPDSQYITDTRITAEKIVFGEFTGKPSGRAEFPGSVAVSYGQMTEFLYMPEKILKAGTGR